MNRLCRMSNKILVIFVILTILGMVWGSVSAVEPTPTDTTPVPTDTTPVPTDTTPVPTDTTPVPTGTTPVPTDTTPVPTDTTPVPTDTTPVPTDTTPQPTDTTPVPTDTTPVPTDTTPQPTDTTPAPTSTTPAPTSTTPAPTSTTPAPTSTTPVPTNTTPVPTNTTPVPTNTTPVPTNTTPAPTSTATSSNPGSSGSNSGSSNGGFTVVSKDANGNIFKYETVEEDLVVNKSIEYSFTTLEFAIYKVIVNGKNNQDQIPVRIDYLINTSRYAMIPAPGIVYRNENVWTGSKRLNYIGIKFKVTNSWLKDNDINESRYPNLLKWNGTTWLVLKTNVTGKDGIYTYFESPRVGTSQLGVFAISSPPKRTNKTTNVWPIPTIIEGNEEEIIEPDIEQIEETLPQKIPGFNHVILIIGMILALMYVIKKR